MRELALHILDLLQNAREAGATMVHLTVEENPTEDRLIIEVKDNGRGMEKEKVDRVKDPFFTTRKTRHVGLGLPLLAAAAERCNGSLTIVSRPGRGTGIRAVFQLSHIDLVPLGELPKTLLAFLLGEPFCDLVYLRRRGKVFYYLDTFSIRREIEPASLSDPEIRQWLFDYLTEEEEYIALSVEASHEAATQTGREVNVQT